MMILHLKLFIRDVLSLPTEYKYIPTPGISNIYTLLCGRGNPPSKVNPHYSVKMKITVPITPVGRRIQNL